MTLRRPFPSSRGPWVLSALLVLTAGDRANVGPPSSGGQLAAEPAGIKNVAIAHEELALDLRSLAENGPAQVEAVYHLENGGAEKKLDLLFASGSPGVAGFRVWLDDRSLASAPAPGAALPPTWQAPQHTPGLHGEGDLSYLHYGAHAVTPLAFTAVVPSGPHTLRVSYAADATRQFYGNPTVYRQFAYVLAPARAWAGFGGLDVVVHLPDGWQAASQPALVRDGDRLRGSFPDVPADAIALTVQAPPGPAYRPVVFGSLGTLGLAGLGGALLCWWGGWNKGRSIGRAAGPRRGWLRRHAWPRSLGLAVLWGLAVLGAGLLAVFGPDWVLPAGQVNHYGYGQPLAVMGVFFLSAVALPVGFVISQVTALLTCHRAADPGS